MRTARISLVAVCLVLACLLAVSSAHPVDVPEATNTAVDGEIPALSRAVSSSTSRGVEATQISTSSISRSGSVSGVLVNNTYLNPAYINGTFNITIDIPEGHVLTELTLEMVGAEAQNHIYTGFPQGGGADGFKYIAPGQTLQSLFECVGLDHYIQPSGIWGRVETVDNASIDDAGRSYYVEMRSANATNYPDAIIVDESYDFTANQLSIAWHYFGFATTVNVTTSGVHWIGINATLLNYTGNGGSTSADHLKSPFENAVGASEEVAQYHPESGYTFLDDRHMPFRLNALRIDDENNTWQAPAAESLGLSAVVSGIERSFSDNITGFGEPTGENGNLTVTLIGNLSSLCDVSWEARYELAGKDRTQPDASYPEGRYPGHLDDPSPWEAVWIPTFWSATGWYWFGVGVLGVLTALLWLTGKQVNRFYGKKLRADEVGLYGGLTLVAVFGALVLAFPRYIDPLVDLAEFLFGWAEYRNWPLWLRGR